MRDRKRILVIEDDAAIRRGLVDALAFDGYDVCQAADGAAGLQHALQSGCDLLLLDLVLPELGGLELLAKLRSAEPTLPVIILTARGEESERVRGLRLGADDYVVKPFSIRELLARVEAVLRRSPQRGADVQQLNVAGARIDLLRRVVLFDDGRQSPLSERETELLRYLARHPQRVISRDELLANVWRIDPRNLATRTIDMQIARLREKLGDTSAGEVIRTVRGQGYLLLSGADPLPD